MSVKVKEGDRVVITGDCVGHGIPIGIDVEVESVMTYGSIVVEYNGRHRAVNFNDYVKSPYLEMIANLSAEVARLSKRVSELERKQSPKELSDKLSEELRKRGVGLDRKPLTREDVIEKAKADVESLSITKTDEGRPWYSLKYALDRKACVADFVVNREKRTVVVLMRGAGTGKLYVKGIAKCAPDDIFNAHIGRAISLRRALGLEVPKEYLNAPKPEGVEVGDVVIKTSGNFIGETRTISRKHEHNVGAYWFSNGKYSYEDSFKVIDDTGRVAK